MRVIFPITFACLLFVGVLSTSCERRPLGDCPQEVRVQRIPVAVDWSLSGITPSSRVESDYVHRVSIRFFPKDGSQVFDRYLEVDVFKGFIDVPVGRYSVVVFNESVYDIYWNDALFFTAIDDYNAFAANLIDDDPANYDFYTLPSGEALSRMPLKLASWSLEDFEVKPSMVGDPMYDALTKIKLRQLTFHASIAVEATNLRSSMIMSGILRGVTRKVMMASAEAQSLPTTHIFRINYITWSNPSQIDGVIATQFLTFGKNPATGAEYTLELDVILKSGARYTPPIPFVFDVTNQVNSNSDRNIEIGVKIALPELSDGVDVGDWDDEEIPVL